MGDVSLLEQSFVETGRAEIDGTFGPGFSDQLDQLAVGDWHGPIRSGLGIHLVKLKSRSTGQLPDLAEIRRLVEREWNNEKRITTRKQMNERMLEDYEVLIEWPKDSRQ